MARPPAVSVAHLVPALFGPTGVVGGAERYTLELARHMAERVPTRLISFGDRDSTSRQGALEIVVVGAPHFVRGQRSNPFAMAAVRKALESDVVHCHQQHILITSATALVARLSGKRVFCTDLGGGGWDVSAYVSTDRLFHGHLHISQFSRGIFGQESLARANVIYGGVDSTTFAPPVEPANRSIECLFVGRLLPHKGVDVLVDAMPADMSLEIIGPAPDARYLDDLHRLAAGKRVTFRHDCDDAALVRAYQSARIVVLPSVYVDRYGGQTNVPELLGQTLLEAMACEAATVTTAVASLPEIVVDGVTGLVVPPNDPAQLRAALESLRRDPDRARAMGVAGRQRALAMFNWSAVVDRCLDAYAT